MNTDETRLIKNIITNMVSVMNATEFTTMHPVSRESVKVVPVSLLSTLIDTTLETLDDCID